MATTPKPRLYTISHVARLLGVHPTSVRDLIAEGRVRSVRFGPPGWHRIPAEEVERLISGA